MATKSTMALPKDYHGQGYFESPALEPGGLFEPQTPIRRKQLLPKSTVRPSSRRVRRLDGDNLVAANPLFQPWTTESSKKILDFSRNLSPRKNVLKSGISLELAASEPNTERRKQTRHAPISATFDSSSVNRTLASTSLSDHDSSASFLPEIDIGDVTLPASLQLTNQPTDLSKRMARLRQDASIEILEDCSSLIAVDPDFGGEEGEVPKAVAGYQSLDQLNTFNSLSPNNGNERSRAAHSVLDETCAAWRPRNVAKADKENVEAAESPIACEKFTEEPVGCQPREPDSISGNPLSMVEVVTPQKPLLSLGKIIRIPQTSQPPKKDIYRGRPLVDCWLDKHSPRKEVKVTMRSLRKEAVASKASKTAFEAAKARIAAEFFCELDTEITDGNIEKLARASGGVKIEWSKTLNTTAGRANWKRETIRTFPSDSSGASVAYKHYASIELAEKVIVDEHRLLNVLAHEFCHLANFMISGITNNPHGKEFKYWAARCSETFASRGIEVTTKHTYDIDFKYVWQCEDCPSSYNRHSKSIDTTKHRCGCCKGKLIQIKPVPRNAGRPSEYQLFIRDEMRALKLENPSSPQKVLMQMAAGRWASRSKVVRSNIEHGDIGDVTIQLQSLSL